MYDISAYNDWAPTDIESDKQVCEDYNKWKGKGGSREDYDKFVEYLLFRKVKQAYKDETEASEDSCPVSSTKMEDSYAAIVDIGKPGIATGTKRKNMTIRNLDGVKTGKI